jgi:hypothetical protein
MVWTLGLVMTQPNLSNSTLKLASPLDDLNFPTG